MVWSDLSRMLGMFNIDRRSPARRRPWAAVRALLTVVGVAGVTLGGLSGCVGYNVYPPEPGDRGFTNVNDDPFPPVVTEALRWAVVRYPPDASTEFTAAAPAGPEKPFALNLPAGMTAMLADRIATNVGFQAQPLYPGNDKLPVYHVGRIWVSGDEAKVDVIRPVTGILAAGGKDATQGITVRLRGGVQPWRVTSHRVWSISAMPVPSLNFVGVPGQTPSAPAPATSAPAATSDGEGQ